MKIIIISLLVLLILIGQIYKIINEKNKIVKETLDMINNDFHRESVQYYQSLKDKGLKIVINDIEKHENVTNWLRLDANNNLVETFNGITEGMVTTKKVSNDIEMCRNLTTCEQLAEFPKCGYCGTTNKFDYNSGKFGERGPDFCPKSEAMNAVDKDGNVIARGNQWARTVFDCNKVKRQNMCDKVTSCGSMAKGTEAGKWCGWCPGDSKAKVKTPGDTALLMYDRTSSLDANSDITSDKCPGLGETNSITNQVNYSELTKAGDCSVCDAPINGVNVGHIGPHSDACLNSLWKATFVDPSGYELSCTTDYDNADNNNANIYKGKGAYWDIGAQMIKDTQQPMTKAIKQHKDTNKWDIKGGEYRRDWEIDNIPGNKYRGPDDHTNKDYGKVSVDKLWKRCFGKNSKNIDIDV